MADKRLIDANALLSGGRINRNGIRKRTKIYMRQVR